MPFNCQSIFAFAIENCLTVMC